MEGPNELREKADNYRRLAITNTDKQAIEALHDLARKYDTLAANLEMKAAPPSTAKD